MIPVRLKTIRTNTKVLPSKSGGERLYHAFKGGSLNIRVFRFILFFSFTFLFYNAFGQPPTGEASPDVQIVCSGVAITDIELKVTNGGSPPTTYSWTRDFTTEVHGLPVSGTTDIISGTPDLQTLGSQVVTYTIIPTRGGVDGDPFTATITVNPDPSVSDYSPPAYCRDDAALGITLSMYDGDITSDAGVSVTWYSDAARTVLVTDVTPGLPTDGGSPVITTYYAIATNDVTFCTSEAELTITVNPTADVNPIEDKLFCAEQLTTEIEFSTDNSGGLVEYTWTNNNPGIGLGASGTGNIPPFTTINTGLDTVIAVIEVIPSFTNGGRTCSGPSETFTITINPIPRLNATFADKIFCDSSIVTFDVSDSLNSYVGEVYYLLARGVDNEDDIVINGGGYWENPGPGEKIEYGQFSDTIINNSLEFQPIYYAFRPLIVVPGGECGGDNALYDFIDTIWINPTPRLSVEVSETIVCDSSTVSFNVVDSLISVLGESRYHLVREYDDSQVKIEGETPDTIKYVVYGSFEDQIINLVGSDQFVKYTFIPVIQDPRGDGTDCSGGEPWTETIIVNPTPRLSVSIPDDKQIYCNEEIVSFTVNDELDGATGIPYYQVTSDFDTASITLVHIEGDGVYGSQYSDQLINKTTQVQTVTYKFYALINDPKGTGSSAPCSHLDTVITIEVLPTPDILVVDSDEDDKLCNLDYIDFAITNPNQTAGSGDWKYILEVEYGDSIRGEYMDLEQYFFDDVDLNIADTLENIGSTFDTVVYRFIPYIISDIHADICPTTINIKTIRLIVDPKPAIRVTAADTVICNNTETDISVHNPHKFSFGDWEYHLVVIPDPEIDGARGDTTIRDDKIPIVDNLINNDTAVHQVRYYFYPLKNIADSLLCEGGDTTMVTIWVNPTPEIRVAVDDTIICDGETFNLTVRNPNDSIRGDWRYDLIIHADPSLAGIPHDTVYSNVTIETFQYELYNTGMNEGEVTFHFIPSITDDDWNPNDGECDGLTYGTDTTITIHVLPVPRINVTADRDSVICNNTEVNLNMTQANEIISGDWRYDLVITADPEIGGISSDTLYNQIRTDSTIYLFNYDTINYDSHRVTFEFIPHINPSDGETECENGVRDTLTFWVNPTPKMSVVASDNIFCDGEEVYFTITDEIGNVPYTTRWYRVVAAFIPAVIDVEDREPGVPSVPEVLKDTVISDRLFNIDEVKEYGEVTYYFTPILRIDANGRQCQGDPVIIKISVNPTPEIEVTMYNDMYLCDSSEVLIRVVDQLGQVTDSIEKVYDLSVEFEDGKVLNVSSPGLKPGELTIRDTLDNVTDTFQVVKYYFTPRLMDTRVGHEGKFCEGARTDSFIVYVNPTPRIQYKLLEDTLCYDDGFILSQDFMSLTTHPMYFNLYSENPDGLLNVTSTLDTPVTDTLLNEQIINEGYDVGSVMYELLPYIDSLGCEGRLDTFQFKVNPLPSMYPVVSDTAVCYNWGYQLPINTDIQGTTGLLKYQLFTDGYDTTVMRNLAPHLPWYDLNPNDTLDQSTVENTGENIEAVTYYFTPVIENAKGPGEHCWAKSAIEHTVEVAPELVGDLLSDSTFVGDLEIRCNKWTTGAIASNVAGGYYKYDYNFDWNTDSGTYGNLDQEAPDQTNLGAGKYWFSVRDTIGCFYSDTIFLDEPDTLYVADTVITFASCYSDERFDGSIDIDPIGGTLGYTYYWEGPFTWGEETEDLYGRVGSEDYYHLTLRDTNNCVAIDSFLIGSAEEILITPDPVNYNGTSISCFGFNDGIIQLEVDGDNPNFDVYYTRSDNPDSTVFAGVATWNGTGYYATVGSLPAGIYNLYVEDAVNCRSGISPVILNEPDPIEITKINTPYFDTVDISCFGAEDGIIEINVIGGHTVSNPYSLDWTGPPGETDLVANDSVQNSLSPGTYSVIVTDVNNCIDTAEFTLIENSQMIISDSIFELHGWNISCNNGSDGYIEINSSGGILNHSYAWSAGHTTLPDSTSANQGNLTAGTYYLTVRDSIGCILQDTFVLNQPNPLGVFRTSSDINGFGIGCVGDSTGWIQLTPFGGADSALNSYFWETTDGYIQDTFAMDQSGLPAGSYTVTVTDINGCPTDSTFVLNEPAFTLSIDSMLTDSASCYNTPSGEIDLTVSGGFPGYTFLWSPGARVADPTVEDPGGLLAGVYTVVVTDSNGCSVIDSVEVFEGDLFTLRIDTATNYNGYPITCYGESDGAIDLEAIGGTEPHSFAWSTGATTEDLEGLPAGTYSVVVTDFYGCQDSATIQLVQPNAINYNIQTSDPRCFNDSTGSIELMITGGTAYALDDYNVLLNDVLAEPFMYNLPEGNYLIRIVDLNECYEQTEVDLHDPEKLVLSFETEEAFCKDKQDGQLSLNVEGGVYPYYVTWDRDLTDGEDDFMDVFWGEYVATVTDANDCVVSDTAFVGYKHISCLVIPNAFSPNSDGFNDLWIIEGLELYPQAELRIFDRWGTSVYHSRNAADDPWDGTLNGRELPVDSYHYIINLNNGEDPETGNVTIVK